jgi:23S rRNA (uracil1939-C5)-methyltransferase
MQLTIQDIAFGGKGVARHEGKVVFVPFTIVGEEITARVVRSKKKFVEAELESVQQASPRRVPPQCPYFQRCGGCSYQHMDYQEQLAVKSRQVEQTLLRVGRLPNVPMLPIVPSPKTYGYRNRIRVHVAGGETGFYARESTRLLDIESCPIAAPAVNASLKNLRAKALPEGDYTVTEGGKGSYFRQTNEAVASAMLSHVKGLLEKESRSTTLVDAYCGAGFFAKGLADLFQTVIGIEENAFAVEAATHTATAKERYLAGDVAQLLAQAFEGQDPNSTTLVIDPPAAGIAPEVVEAILAFRPTKMIYVSCNPATLARDLSQLVSVYRLLSVTPCDMFPQTAEIEVVTSLAL